MSDLNRKKLRQLAHEASETEMGWLDRGWLASIMADDWADYVAAVDPEVVIELLDENERLREEHDKAWRIAGINLENLGVALTVSARLRAEAEALRGAMLAVSIVIDGDIRATVRDCVNGLPDVQDIYGYCDNIDAIIGAALSKGEQP